VGKQDKQGAINTGGQTMIKKSMLILGISLMAISVLPANSIAGSGNKYKVTIETNTIDGVGFPDGVSFDVLCLPI
jgi:hypothetical protein